MLATQGCIPPVLSSDTASLMSDSWLTVGALVAGNAPAQTHRPQSSISIDVQQPAQTGALPLAGAISKMWVAYRCCHHCQSTSEPDPSTWEEVDFAALHIKQLHCQMHACPRPHQSAAVADAGCQQRQAETGREPFHRLWVWPPDHLTQHPCHICAWTAGSSSR